MSPSVERIVERVRDAEDKLTREVAAEQRRWHYRAERGRIWFDQEVQQAHRRLRQGVPSYIREGSIRSLLTAPVIYSLLLPLVLLDFWVSMYQWICFPIYGIARVPRRAYFVVDRRRLAYLNAIERLNCTFCSYGNGLIAYVCEVAARTEQYWCPIKHANSIPTPHSRYHLFLDYGDAAGYRHGLTALRRALPRTGSHDARNLTARRRYHRRAG